MCLLRRHCESRDEHKLQTILEYECCAVNGAYVREVSWITRALTALRCVAGSHGDIVRGVLDPLALYHHTAGEADANYKATLLINGGDAQQPHGAADDTASSHLAAEHGEHGEFGSLHSSISDS